ncbi:MAG: site-specific DNA-methyltransferase [Leptospiraceae bacterium]|nr:site-specific DNA-methyltransferase [Leptospiraceae bacterium]
MPKEKEPKPIEQYTHKDKDRLNNPPAGLVKPGLDGVETKKTYAYDPHIDPSLQWAGKAEKTSFEIPTVSLHVHERIDPRTIMEAVRNRKAANEQPSLFTAATENPPLQEAIEFYKHKHDWSNRLVAGDSLLVMNSLIEKEGMGSKVQMIYFDPPYGIKYGSNFQPFINKRDVKDGNDDDLTTEPEMLKAFRDTWELGIHSYLSYMRDRLLLAKELLADTGSIFVQISDENIHHVREIMDEVFGAENFVSLIPFRKKAMTLGANLLENMYDYLLWYSKNKDSIKYNKLFTEDDGSNSRWDQVELPNGEIRSTTQEEKDNHFLLPKDAKVFNPFPIQAPSFSQNSVFSVEWKGKEFWPPKGTCWITSDKNKLLLQLQTGRIFPYGNSLAYKQYLEDFPFKKLTNIWNDTRLTGKVYIVQTSTKVIQRCLLMTTDPGDLVFDLTCGSGTTAFVAEQWGRRWITCDTSRVAITLAKQRLMTGIYDYYVLDNPKEGVSGNFTYKKVPHVTLKSIANNPEIREGMSREQIEKAIAKHADSETLYDQPLVDSKKARVTGPFTVEAVPALTVKSLDEIRIESERIVDGKRLDVLVDSSIARENPTLRHNEWRSELMKSGIRAKNGVKTSFAFVNTMPTSRWIHADAKTVNGERVVISFGPEHAPLGKVHVSRAIEEAEILVPKPKIVVFASFHFDPEASKTIDSLKWEGVTLVKVQMNADLITDDLKKKQSSSESFWYIGQPDISLRRISHGKDTGKFYVEVHGFDYYDPKSGKIVQGDAKRIAMWMLDPDYDGRSLFPRQVFFPMSGEKDGWARLAKNLKTEIDEGLIEHYAGTVSLPFELGEHKRVAIKIVDDRGIETIRVVEEK